MFKKIINRHESFANAIAGLWWVMKTQPNYYIHLILSLLAVYMGWKYSISELEWVVIVIIITLGLVIETINSAVEVTTDAIAGGERRDDIKIAKDVSAAAMLVYAVGALIVAWLIFRS